MRSLDGYSRTGRIQKGPGSDLVEMAGPDGARHTAIEFHPEYRSHNAINAALGVVLSFLESPMVSGLADLGAYDLANSTFVYPTGQTWSVAEVVRTLSDLGEVGGVRAGVELMAQAGMVLVEAAETGELAGVYSHGGLTPWRVMLDADGRLQIIGHALPQVEILTFHEQPDRIPREDAFRYCPPERMEAKRENFSSDLFGLGLIAFEVMCGKPVYDGLVNDIRAKAARGETSRRIHQFREFLPESVRVLLTTTLRPDFRDRFGSGSDFFEAVNAALADPAVEGVGLREMMQRVIRQQPRARQDLDPAKTSMLSKDELRKMMDEEDAPAARPQRAAFAPPSRAAAPSRPAAPASSGPAASPVSAPPASAAPAPDAAAIGALGASSSRVGLPPARRPPPRTGGEVLGDAGPAPVATPIQAPVSASAPAAGAPAAGTPGDTPRYGPPLRSGVRPNPRASGIAPAGDTGAASTGASAAPSVASIPSRSAEPAARASEPARTDAGRPGADRPDAGRPDAGRPAEPGRPAVGVARLPPSRRPPGVSSSGDAPAGDATPDVPARADAPRAVPPPPAVNSGDRAKDLLARVRASGSSATSDAFPRASTPSPSAVLDRILTSSGSGQALRDRVARAVQESGVSTRPSEPDANGSSVAQPPVRGGIATSPTSAAPTPTASAPAGLPVATGPSAGAPPSDARAAASAAPVATPASQAGAPSQATAPPPTTPSAPASSQHTGAAASASPASTAPPASTASPASTAPPASTASPASTPSRSPAATPAQLADAAARATRARVPDPLKSGLRGDPQPYKLARGAGTPAQRRRVPAQSSLADIVGFLVGQMVPLRTTLDGRLAGWWRLGPASGPLPADTRLDTLDPDTALVFHFVESRVVLADLEVHTGESTVRLRAPVGTAVPVQTLLDAVASLLDLPGGDWTLSLDGAPLEPFHILEDRAFGAGSALVVRRA